MSWRRRRRIAIAVVVIGIVLYLWKFSFVEEDDMPSDREDFAETINNNEKKTKIPDPFPYNQNCASRGDPYLPTCPFCKDKDMGSVSVYFEEFDKLNSNYWNAYSTREVNIPKTCLLPNGAKCIPQHSDKMADVVFRAQSFRRGSLPTRYCYPQIISILNSEVESSDYASQPQVQHAEVHIDFHPESEVCISDACSAWYREALINRKQPDPSKRSGVAMFLSNCPKEHWRTEWITNLIQYVQIDMHGTCFHNVNESSDRQDKQFIESFIKKASTYKAIVTMENHIQKAYISEKIFAVYASGAIPVYWGPPDIHQWLPGNHTFVDLSKYGESQENAANYIKRILEDDEIFKYHTSNFDVDKVLKFTKKVCSVGDYVCSLCKHAYKLKEASLTERRACNCHNQPPKPIQLKLATMSYRLLYLFMFLLLVLFCGVCLLFFIHCYFTYAN